MSTPRVRIAPSPTGFLHIGTARIALANYIYAKKFGGSFVLRIEDTDLERSDEKYIQNIYSGLNALGLTWDEGPNTGGAYGPYIQSERMDVYTKMANLLLEKGLAYRCYCTAEELEQEKALCMAQKSSIIYSGKCSNITEEQEKQYIAEGRKPTIRFRVPHKTIVINDIIKKELIFETPLIGDFVLVKSNGMPTYNFAVVVDDVDMKITHVIRGEDHISNTPKQILIYEALNQPVPTFAHMPMILAPDKTKLSKRHGATAVSDFIEEGYLPEAFVNFLALMGWSSPDGEEIKSIDELVSLFDLGRVSPSPAIFDKDKLNWINGMYIRTLPVEDITNRCKKYLSGYDLSKYPEEKLQLMVKVVREPLTVLGDIKEAVSYFFAEDIIIDEQVKNESLSEDSVRHVLQTFVDSLETLNFDSLELLEEQFKEFRKSMKPLKPKQILMPIRVALTGQLHGADLSVCIFLLGKNEVAKRLNKVIATL